MVEQLTEEEIKIIDLTMEGIPSKQIALDVGYTTINVNKKLQRIYGKLGVDNKVRAVLKWHRIRNKYMGKKISDVKR